MYEQPDGFTPMILFLAAGFPILLAALLLYWKLLTIIWRFLVRIIDP
jgi:hypothetical protein